MPPCRLMPLKPLAALRRAYLVAARNEVVLAYWELLAVLKASAAAPVDDAQLKGLVPVYSSQTQGSNTKGSTMSSTVRRAWMMHRWMMWREGGTHEEKYAGGQVARAEMLWRLARVWSRKVPAQ
jgi:hypothetical protein